MGDLGIFVGRGPFLWSFLDSSFLSPCLNLALTNSFRLLGRLQLFTNGFYKKKPKILGSKIIGRKKIKFTKRFSIRRFQRF